MITTGRVVDGMASAAPHLDSSQARTTRESAPGGKGASGSGNVPVVDRVLRRNHQERRQRIGLSVHGDARSAIASSSAALRPRRGAVDLIGQGVCERAGGTRIRRLLAIETPVTSVGGKSGVHWMREGAADAPERAVSSWRRPGRLERMSLAQVGDGGRVICGRLPRHLLNVGNNPGRRSHVGACRSVFDMCTPQCPARSTR
jgi:hypothetical protein